MHREIRLRRGHRGIGAVTPSLASRANREICAKSIVDYWSGPPAPHIQYTGWIKKPHHGLVTLILSNDNRLKNPLEDSLVNFKVKWILKIPPHLAHVATLPCETVMSAKQALNDKLQGSVAAHLRCGGVVNNQIKKGILLSLRVKEILKSVNIWQS